MLESQFNPFEERLARDIRNRISRTILHVFTEMDMSPARRIAKHYLTIPHDSVHEKYIHDRLSRYEQALEIIRDEKLTDTWDRALVLWDLRLFSKYMKYWSRAGGRQQE